jgi:hypothetical protein
LALAVHVPVTWREPVTGTVGQPKLQWSMEKRWLVRSYSTEMLVRQKAKGLSLDALLGTRMSTLLKSELEVANTPVLSQQRENWVIGIGTPLVHLPS